LGIGKDGNVGLIAQKTLVGHEEDTG